MLSSSVVLATAFFLVYTGILTLVQFPARRQPAAEAEADLPLRPSQLIGTEEPLEPLEWEHEYARSTAAEAMRDRHTTINFYLLVVGVAATGLLGITKIDSTLPLHLAGGLLWVVCTLGAFYFLILVKLRESWYESALQMLKIREFTVSHVEELPTGTLRDAFRWSRATLPAKHKRWTVFYYSAMLIAFLNAFCFLLGAVLIAHELQQKDLFHVFLFSFFALLVMIFYDWLYKRLLSPTPGTTPPNKKQGVSS